MKKVYGVVLILSLVIASPISNVEAKIMTGGELLMRNYEEEISFKKVQGIKNKKIEENYEEAKKNYNEIYSVVYKEKSKKYRNEYSGTYMNDDQNLVVMTNKSSEEFKEDLREVTNNDELIFKTANYSYNELLDTYNTLTNKISKGSLDCVKSVYISQTNNCVVVGINEINVENMTLIKDEVKNSDILKFEVCSDDTATASVHPGQQIKIGNGYYSMGFRAYYSTSTGKKVYGFVTAGHNTSINDEVHVITSKGNSVKVGKVAKRRLKGSVDVSFIELTNSAEAKRKVYYKNSNNTDKANGVILANNFISIVVEGEAVCKSGYRTHTTSGKVKSIAYTSNMDTNGDGKTDVTLKNMIRTTCYGGPGDSGGILYEVHGDNAGIVGIQSSGINSTRDAATGNYKQTVFTSADYITALNWGTNGLWIY